MPKKKLGNSSICIDISPTQRIFRVDDLNWVLQVKRPMYDKRGRDAQPTGDYKWTNYSFHSGPGDACKTAISITEDVDIRGDLDMFRKWYARKCEEMVTSIDAAVSSGLKRMES